jgi:rod shape-determining protein MreC
VGIVAAFEGDIVRVEPYAELTRLEFVRIVDFGLTGVLPQSAVPPPKAPRAPRGSVPEAAR